MAVHFTEADARETIAEFCALESNDARIRFRLGDDSRDWQVALAQADARSALASARPLCSTGLPALRHPLHSVHRSVARIP